MLVSELGIITKSACLLLAAAQALTQPLSAARALPVLLLLALLLVSGPCLLSLLIFTFTLLHRRRLLFHRSILTPFNHPLPSIRRFHPSAPSTRLPPPRNHIHPPEHPHPLQKWPASPTPSAPPCPTWSSPSSSAGRSSRPTPSRACVRASPPGRSPSPAILRLLQAAAAAAAQEAASRPSS